jgi:hypothetical protein
MDQQQQQPQHGEYASAIEKLFTAISLIKQPNIANEDRCKILIRSLHDTLHEVMTKSYGSARRENKTHTHLTAL